MPSDSDNMEADSGRLNNRIFSDIDVESNADLDKYAFSYFPFLVLIGVALVFVYIFCRVFYGKKLLLRLNKRGGARHHENKIKFNKWEFNFWNFNKILKKSKLKKKDFFVSYLK